MRVLILVATMLLPGLASAKPSLDGWEDWSLMREMEMVKKYDLTRLKDQRQLKLAISQGLVVRVPDSGPGFRLDRRIGGHDAGNNRVLYKHARPYAEKFIRNLGAQYHERSGDAFVVSSLVRTCVYQKWIVARGNSNAAPCEMTSHTTGTTVDIPVRSIDRKHRAWLRGVLLDLEAKGLILATEEKHQSVFHIMVLPSYEDYREPRGKEVLTQVGKSKRTRLT